ncbi:MAG: glycosyltransferase family 39 protein [Chitinivibrionales bacterium]
MNDKHFRLSFAGIDWLLLALICAAMEFPFINKALQADSDMLVHAACMVAAQPIAPPIGEYGRHMATYNIHTGMPAASLYYRCPHGPLLPLLLAPISMVAGKAEWPFHLALFPFTVAAVCGCYFILLLLTKRDIAFVTAVLISLAPLFVVNCQNIMWDVPVFAFMVWSLGLLIDGVRRLSVPLLVLSGSLASCAAITKMSSFPLLVCGLAFLIIARNVRLFAAWTVPAFVLPIAWILHNLSLYHVTQYLSTGHLNFLPADIRYKMERFAPYIGGLAAFPLGWWWLALRGRINAVVLFAGIIGGLAWMTALHAILGCSIMYAITCGFLGIAGTWASVSTFFMLLRDGQLTVSGKERFLLCGFFLAYGGFILVIPTAEPRFVIPLLPFLTLLLTLRVYALTKKEYRVALPVLIAGQALLALAVSASDALSADSDRQLPHILAAKGYGPFETWYYGRLQFDYYLWRAGYSRCGVDTGHEDRMRFAVEARVPPDLSVKNILPNRVSLTLADTIAVHRFPLRAGPPGCGIYGEDRLPYRLDFLTPLKSYSVYALHMLGG